VWDRKMESLMVGDYICRAEDTEMLSQVYFERWGLLTPPPGKASF